MKYDDTWLSLEVFVDNNLTVKGNCNWHLISNYWGQYYEYRCNNRKLTQAERTKIEQEIVNTLRSQFQRFNDYVIKPLNLNYKKKFPLQVMFVEAITATPAQQHFIKILTRPKFVYAPKI